MNSHDAFNPSLYVEPLRFCFLNPRRVRYQRSVSNLHRLGVAKINQNDAKRDDANDYLG